MKLIYLFTAVLFLTACAQAPAQASQNTSPQQAQQTTAPASAPSPPASSQSADTVVSCTSDENTDLTVRGAVHLEYANGQKESFENYCPEKTEAAFTRFVVTYICDGNAAKERLTACPGNTTCDRGVCG